MILLITLLLKIPWLLAAQIPSYVTVAIMIVLIVILMRRSGRYFGRGRRNKNSIHFEKVRRPDPEKPEIMIDAPKDIARWDVYVHERSREIEAILDSKMRALLQLVAIAKEQEESLRKTIDEASRKKSDST